MMNKILQDLFNTREVVSFIDNIIVGTKEEKGHNKVVRKVVKWLAENNLYVKLGKCKQKVREVGFLGVVIRPEGIKMKDEKIKKVLNWLTLKKVKNIQNLLGLTSYYQYFIKIFVAIARPLHNLVKKDQKWNWIEKQEKVFKKLKEKFTKELVLVVLNLD